MKKVKIPEATIARLSVYSRFLNRMEKNGVDTVSSGEIAKGTASNSAQVRKDFAYFGGFGKRGVGYDVIDLNRNIKEILGLNKEWRAIIVGMGNLGKALAYYHGFSTRGFKIMGLFDNDPQKIGEKIDTLTVQDDQVMEKFLDNNEIDIMILTLPAEYTQAVVDRVEGKGIKGILNFAPTVIHASEGTQIRNVDLAVHLEVMSYNLTHSINKEQE